MLNKSFGEVFAAGLAPSGLKQTTQVVANDITPRDVSFWSSFFSAHNWSGQAVNRRSALQLSTVMACVRLISETLSTLPLGLFTKAPNGAPVPAEGHNLYYLLHSQPNGRMSAAVFWQAYIASLLLDGNAYVEKIYSGETIVSLELLIPHLVSRRLQPNGRVEWHYADPLTRTPRVIPEERMWHLPAFTLDGITGLSPVSYGANIMGGAMATDEASADVFRGRMKSTGLVTMDAILKKEQRDEIRAHVKKVSDAGGVMVLEKGASYQQLSMNAKDAELLSSRAFNIEEICRWFGVPPFMVGHSEKTTSWGTGIEQQMIGFVTFVLRRWSVRIEQGIRKDLLTPVERLKYSAEFALEGLLRGDSAARAAFYSAMVNNGVMTRDECRRLENLPAMGGNAAELTVQSAMLPIDKLGQNAGVTPPPPGALDALKNWIAINR